MPPRFPFHGRPDLAIGFLLGLGDAGRVRDVAQALIPEPNHFGVLANAGESGSTGKSQSGSADSPADFDSYSWFIDFGRFDAGGNSGSAAYRTAPGATRAASASRVRASAS